MTGLVDLPKVSCNNGITIYLMNSRTLEIKCFEQTDLMDEALSQVGGRRRPTLGTSLVRVVAEPLL
jgi:hypothetical protein